MILNEYEYGYEKTFSGKAPKWVKKSTEDMLKVFGKDCDDNNILHHCYMYDMPGVRQMLRNSDFVNKDRFDLASTNANVTVKRKDKNMAVRMNKRGLRPNNLRHKIKAEDSNEEST